MQVPQRLAARLHNVFGQNLGLPQLVFKSRQAVLDTVQVLTARAQQVAYSWVVSYAD